MARIWNRHLAVFALAMSATSSAHGQGGITARATISEFFQAASVGRVDMVMIGDSNQLSWTEGWDRGMLVAFSERYPIYATGLMPSGENKGNSFGIGYECYTFFTANGPFLYEQAPEALDKLLRPNIGMLPHDYLFVPIGTTVPPTQNQGLVVTSFNPIDITGPLRFRTIYGTFTGPDHGSFRPVVRQLEAPHTQYAVAPAIDTNTGAWGAASVSLDVPAGPRSGVWGRFMPVNSPETQPIVGPFISYFQRAENTARATGVSTHTMLGFPGKTARAFAETLQLADDSQLSLYFAEVRALQGPAKRVMVRINTGINDRVESLPSVGPKKVAAGNSAEAYADNLQAIIDRIAGVWALNGWEPGELFFDLAPSHPISNPDDALLVAYRDAADGVALANPRTCVTRFDVLTNHDEMVAKQWYFFAGDKLHLSIWGYEGISRRELDAMRACGADMDDDKALTIDDFIAFQTLFALGSPSADLDDDGALSIDDFIAYQTFFAIGCP